MSTRLERLKQPWRVQTSIRVNALIVLGFSAYTYEYAQSVIGPNAGVYEIAGAPTIQFIAFHWFALLALIIGLMAYNYSRGGQSTNVEQVGRWVVLVTLVVVVLEALWVVPNGSHVIYF